ncbi:MAG: hypothetical protein HY917_01120 [Candidatus Diapherotrites archaeon]|nr:hypothetical protein [Candidatus Diapherotrites archaeon]
MMEWEWVIGFLLVLGVLLAWNGFFVSGSSAWVELGVDDVLLVSGYSDSLSADSLAGDARLVLGERFELRVNGKMIHFCDSCAGSARVCRSVLRGSDSVILCGFD